VYSADGFQFRIVLTGWAQLDRVRVIADVVPEDQQADCVADNALDQVYSAGDVTDLFSYEVPA